MAVSPFDEIGNPKRFASTRPASEEHPGDQTMKREIKRLALNEGAAAVGVASADRLGSVASMDPNYILPGARSIVSLMLPLRGDLVHRYLSKEDHDALEHHEVETYRELYRVGQRYRATRADLLQVLGIPDEPAAAPGPAARTAPDPSAPATATGPGTKERREAGVWRGAA